MKKADLLEELRCELSLISKELKEEKERYNNFIHLLKSKIPHYKTVVIYLTNESEFYYYGHEGELWNSSKRVIPFGEDFFSVVAARGEISCEFEPDGQILYIPFYEGHFLTGEILIKTSQFVDEEELNILTYIQDILNKVPK